MRQRSNSQEQFRRSNARSHLDCRAAGVIKEIKITYTARSQLQAWQTIRECFHRSRPCTFLTRFLESTPLAARSEA